MRNARARVCLFLLCINSIWGQTFKEKNWIQAANQSVVVDLTVEKNGLYGDETIRKLILHHMCLYIDYSLILTCRQLAAQVLFIISFFQWPTLRLDKLISEEEKSGHRWISIMFNKFSKTTENTISLRAPQTADSSAFFDAVSAFINAY